MYLFQDYYLVLKYFAVKKSTSIASMLTPGRPTLSATPTSPGTYTLKASNGKEIKITGLRAGRCLVIILLFWSYLILPLSIRKVAKLDVCSS